MPRRLLPSTLLIAALLLPATAMAQPPAQAPWIQAQAPASLAAAEAAYQATIKDYKDKGYPNVAAIPGRFATLQQAQSITGFAELRDKYKPVDVLISTAQADATEFQTVRPMLQKLAEKFAGPFASNDSKAAGGYLMSLISNANVLLSQSAQAWRQSGQSWENRYMGYALNELNRDNSSEAKAVARYLSSNRRPLLEAVSNCSLAIAVNAYSEALQQQQATQPSWTAEGRLTAPSTEGYYAAAIKLLDEAARNGTSLAAVAGFGGVNLEDLRSQLSQDKDAARERQKAQVAQLMAEKKEREAREAAEKEAREKEAARQAAAKAAADRKARAEAEKRQQAITKQLVAAIIRGDVPATQKLYADLNKAGGDFNLVTKIAQDSMALLGGQAPLGTNLVIIGKSFQRLRGGYLLKVGGDRLFFLATSKDLGVADGDQLLVSGRVGSPYSYSTVNGSTATVRSLQLISNLTPHRFKLLGQ